MAGWKGRGAITQRLAALVAYHVADRPAPSLKALAQRWDVHPKTIRRDLEALEAQGLTVRLRPEGEA